MPIAYPKSAEQAAAPHQNRNRSDSYPSLSSSSSDVSSEYDSDEEAALIQEEWEESLRQIEVVLSIVIIPFFGRWYGRRFSYWAYARYQQLGLTRAFFGMS